MELKIPNNFHSENMPFHIKSPLILSHELSLLNSDDNNKINVFLKLDNVQPSGNFNDLLQEPIKLI